MIAGETMYKSYKMIKSKAEASFIERKSEFISNVMPIYSDEEASNFLNLIRKKHYNATHNCYAYILGEDSMTQRSSDDGEPSGTAGLPILEVIRKEGLTNTIIVVTRYFGGVLLGAGGLIRAYTESAALGIKASGKVIVQPYAVFTIGIEYSQLGKLQYEIQKKDYIIDNIQYNENVALTLLVLPEAKEQLYSDIAEWTNGTAQINFIEIEMKQVDEK